MKNFRCRDCNKGEVVASGGNGRVEKYKDKFITLPEDLLIPTCNYCGAEWMNESSAKAIDAALEVEYNKLWKTHS